MNNNVLVTVKQISEGNWVEQSQFELFNNVTTIFLVHKRLLVVQSDSGSSSTIESFASTDGGKWESTNSSITSSKICGCSSNSYHLIVDKCGGVVDAYKFETNKWIVDTNDLPIIPPNVLSIHYFPAQQMF